MNDQEKRDLHLAIAIGVTAVVLLIFWVQVSGRISDLERQFNAVLTVLTPELNKKQQGNPVLP